MRYRNVFTWLHTYGHSGIKSQGMLITLGLTSSKMSVFRPILAHEARLGFHCQRAI